MLRLILRRRAAVVTIAASAALLSGIGTATAATPDAGLYGAADPTYDGVFRQSLGLLGLAAHDITPSASAVTWLLNQQCADGSFEDYRPDTSVPCAAPDPATYAGPDTNSTAMALMALMALDDSRIDLKRAQLSKVVNAAEAAGRWIRQQQNSDGGWPYFPGGASDANSTGLALAAANTWGGNVGSSSYRAAMRFLGSTAASCASGGGFAYQAGSRPDGLATSQGVLGITGSLPVTRQPAASATAACANTARAKGISYLASNLSRSGLLESAMGGPDYASTAYAVLGLSVAREGRAAIARGTTALKANARSYATGSPGAAGLLLMVAEATGAKPTSFGGVNLVTTLASSMRR
jgi:Prenyltransferase and squalene oxidase repeat